MSEGREKGKNGMWEVTTVKGQTGSHRVISEGF